MRIVLIGGAGLIGHSLALELARQGHTPFVVDSLMVNNLLVLDDLEHIKFTTERLALLNDAGIPLMQADARNYTLLSPMIKRLRPDVMIHLAAVAHMDRSKKTPFDTFDHSLVTLENALDIAVNTNVKKFVYFSSSTVYGEFESDSVTEDSPLNPVGTYGSLKLAGELMVKAYTHDKGMKHVIIRPSALYGERCVSGRVVQKFVEAAISGQPLKISGDEPLDFTYIDDLVQGVVLSLKAENETFNITYGQSRTVGEMAKIIAGYVGGTEILLQNEPTGRPRRGTLVVDKARALLGYDPKFHLEAGVRKYLDWYIDGRKPNSRGNTEEVSRAEARP